MQLKEDTFACSAHTVHSFCTAANAGTLISSFFQHSMILQQREVSTVVFYFSITPLRLGDPRYHTAGVMQPPIQSRFVI